MQYVETNKSHDSDWFRLESSADGTQWTGRCWRYVDMRRYEFDIEFDVPVSYPTAPPEIALPQLDGKTVKMYRGGRVCMSDHFRPLWTRNVPKFGIAHAMALGVSRVKQSHGDCSYRPG